MNKITIIVSVCFFSLFIGCGSNQIHKSSKDFYKNLPTASKLNTSNFTSSYDYDDQDGSTNIVYFGGDMSNIATTEIGDYLRWSAEKLKAEAEAEKLKAEAAANWRKVRMLDAYLQELESASIDLILKLDDLQSTLDTFKSMKTSIDKINQGKLSADVIIAIKYFENNLKNFDVVSLDKIKVGPFNDNEASSQFKLAAYYLDDPERNIIKPFNGTNVNELVDFLENTAKYNYNLIVGSQSQLAMKQLRKEILKGIYMDLSEINRLSKQLRKEKRELWSDINPGKMFSLPQVPKK